jgi:hypothetical protein
MTHWLRLLLLAFALFAPTLHAATLPTNPEHDPDFWKNLAPWVKRFEYGNAHLQLGQSEHEWNHNLVKGKLLWWTLLLVYHGEQKSYKLTDVGMVIFNPMNKKVAVFTGQAFDRFVEYLRKNASDWNHEQKFPSEHE